MIRKTFLLLLILSACAHPDKDNEALTKEVIKTDQDFSKMSVEKGRKEAFLFYVADSVIMMRQGGLPLLGKAALAKQFENNPGDQFILKWNPVSAEASGNIGYTFGNWELRIKGKDTVQYGNYVTVWKKFPDGKWKFILDGGNDTPKPKL